MASSAKGKSVLPSISKNDLSPRVTKSTTTKAQSPKTQRNADGSARKKMRISTEPRSAQEEALHCERRHNAAESQARALAGREAEIKAQLIQSESRLAATRRAEDQAEEALEVLTFFINVHLILPLTSVGLGVAITS